MRATELDGYWWLPGRESEKLAGTVFFDGKSGPRLKLIGAFPETRQASAGVVAVTGPEDAPLLYGQCRGKEVTLIDCTSTDYSSNLSRDFRDWRQVLVARLMLVGIWLDNPDERYFDQIDVGVDHLLAWSRHSGLVDEHYATDGRTSGTGFRWERTEALVAEVDQARVRLALGSVASRRSWADSTDRTLKETGGFVVEEPSPAGASELIERWVKPLQDLLTLATGRACGVYEVELARRQPTDPEDVELGRRYPITVQAYFQPIYASELEQKAVMSHELLFSLADVPFQEVLPRWLQVREALSPVPGMLFGLQYIGRSFAESQLITSVAAAEALHRRLLPQATYVAEEPFTQLLAAVLAAAGDEHANWVNDRLHNEPTLKQRLMQLAARLGDDLVHPFMPKPNWWAQQAKDARNALVHHFADPPAPEPEVMVVLARMTAQLITLNLLDEVGVPKERLTALVRQHASFRWFGQEGRSLAPGLFPKPKPDEQSRVGS